MRRFIYPRTAGIITKGSADSAASSPVRVLPVSATRTQVVLALALEADVDPRSARKAIEEGADAIRGRAGERLAIAAKTLGITLGQGTTPTEPNSAA